MTQVLAGPVLKVAGVSKSFEGVPVLRDIGFDVRAGEVHALLGENGAGKSVLMKILMGVHQPEQGDYYIAGRKVRFADPAEAQRNRVSMVYQEFGLVQDLSVTENVLMGRLPTRWGVIDWPKARRITREILTRLGSVVSADAIVGELKVADQQEIEIARALSYDPLVFIMDEPSAALSRVEIDNLYQLVRLLRSRGVAIIYISHKLEEVFALADRVTVIRDGNVVGTYSIDDLTMPLLIEKMTGKPISADLSRARGDGRSSADVLRLANVSAEGLFEDVSLSVTKGAIVGVAGVIGAGKSELARAIIGGLPEGIPLRGTMYLNGASIDLRKMTPNKARRLAIGFVPEDRQSEGIIQLQSVAFNVVLPALRFVTAGFTLIRSRIRSLVNQIIDDVRLRPRDQTRQVRFLSGGNQQKVVVGKWLAAQSELLILDEPTRGIDIGARDEIYQVLRKQARDQGVGVLLLTSDLREALAASDRILVMCRGRIVRDVYPHQVTEHELLEMVLGENEPAGGLASMQGLK
jgi:ABC-type sugar transport system ATPase subunit